MANKDFFDEEYDKMKKDGSDKIESERGTDFDEWYARPTPEAETKKERKPIYIVLIAVALALCILLGWFLCAIFGGTGKGLNTREQQKYLDTIYRSLNDSGISVDEETWSKIVGDSANRVENGEVTAEALLSVVFDTLYNDYYQSSIPKEKWYQAVEEAGTALFQVAGDQFSRLLSPISYYSLMNQTSSMVSGSNGVFGISYQHVSGVGLYVSDVMANSPFYGRAQSGDIIVKVYNMLDVNGNNVLSGSNEALPAEWDSDDFTQLLANVNQASFNILRDGEIIKYDNVRRSVIKYVNSDYDFDFIEFYFGDDCCNVSLSPLNGAAVSTKQERLLGNLPSDTGYIRITEFGTAGTSSADDEFAEALRLFKSRNLKNLVLDLKGNPGGNVDIVCNIAGMLVNSDKLTQSNKNAVTNAKGELLITSLVPRNPEKTETYYVKSTYSEYFDNSNSGKCNIAVWTDGGSASASELLTGALTDYGTAVQMGTRTYGKGIAQSVEPLTQFSESIVTPTGTVTSYWARYYTVAKYNSPLGQNIHGIGYIPQNQYDNLDTYAKLWDKTSAYFGSVGGIGTDIPA